MKTLYSKSLKFTTTKEVSSEGFNFSKVIQNIIVSQLLSLTLMFDLLLICYLRANCPLELVIHNSSVKQKKPQENSHDQRASSCMSSKRLDLPYFIVFVK